jgi:hypothetical protein
MVFEDRISAYPNRYTMTDENGNVSHVILERADEPTIPGTPLNAETFNKMIASEATVVTDWNTATANGFYCNHTGTTDENAPFPNMAAWGYTIAHDPDDAITQIAFTYATPSWEHTLCKKVRHLKKTVGWSEWEWENPPLEIGKTYRTTERFYGNPVYVKAIDFGTAPVNDSREVELTDGDTLHIGDIVRIEGYWLQGSWMNDLWVAGIIKKPFVSAPFITDIKVDSHKFTVSADETANGYKGRPVIYFTQRVEE